MEATDLLRTAGWRPGRSIDVSEDLAALQAKGFGVTPAAEALLREFSRLTVQAPGKSNPLIIDGMIAARDASVGWAEAYSAALGCQLIPVGEYSNLMFWIDPDGAIWATFDDDYGRAGASLHEAIQGLFFESPGWQLDRTLE